MGIFKNNLFRTFFSLGVLALAIASLANIMGQDGFDMAITQAIAKPPVTILMAIGLTGASFVTLGALELLNAQSVGLKPSWRIFSNSLVGNALAHSIGGSVFGAASARVFLYQRLQASPKQVAVIVMANTASYLLGILVLLAGLLGLGAWYSEAIPSQLGIIVSGACLILVIGHCLSGHWAEKSSNMLLRFAPRTWWLGIIQILLGGLNLALVGAALFTLTLDTNYFPFLASYLVSTLAGSISTIPGGIGVFEATMLVLRPGNGGQLLTAIIMFRLIYNVIPLALALGALALGWLGSTKLYAMKSKRISDN